MLFRSNTLKLIKGGSVTVAFRKWKKPSVKEGGYLHSPVGLLSIKSVSPASVEEISEADFQRAGISDRNEFLEYIAGKQGALYRVEFALVGADPRIALSNQSKISGEDLKLLQSKLDGMDARSKYGPWAYKVLHLIRDNPGKPARWICERMDLEKDWLKPNIRKLKNLGLTISLEVGYEISQRGKAFLGHLAGMKSSDLEDKIAIGND